MESASRRMTEQFQDGSPDALIVNVKMWRAKARKIDLSHVWRSLLHSSFPHLEASTSFACEELSCDSISAGQCSLKANSRLSAFIHAFIENLLLGAIGWSGCICMMLSGHSSHF